MSDIDRFRQLLNRTPILYRIAIGNAFVITIGAIGGTFITRQLADRAAEWWLILLFISVGTLLSVVINFWIIKNALRPLNQLSTLVDQVQNGQTQIDPQYLQPTDPDIYQLTATLDSLVRQLNARNLELRALSERAINSLEEERRRIALTLHDDTGQALTMLIINLDHLEGQLPPGEDQIRAQLHKSRELARDSLASLRKIVYGLRPTILDDLGLIPAIRWYARTNLEEAGIMVEIHTDEDIPSISSHLSANLFRIAQEAVNNIVRHSKATTVDVSLHQQDGEIILEVNDDGQGFDIVNARGEALQLQHLGLLSIQERAELAGGELAICSKPGRGTQIIVSVPLAGSGEM